MKTLHKQIDNKLQLNLLASILFISSIVALRNAQATQEYIVNDNPIKQEQNVERAIALVYPALVRIQAVNLFYNDGRERKFEAVGSGVIISRDGYVITNHHVADKPTSLRCVLSSKEELDAVLIGSDALTDIAVLKLDLSGRDADAPPLPVAQFGSSQSLQVGDTVFAMGCPLALSQSVTKGIVANTDMMLSKGFDSQFELDGEQVGSLVKWIGHDAQILPGNSGGPLVNLRGEVVGVNEIRLDTIGGAIPSDLVQVIAQELIEHKIIRRAWIGVSFQPQLSRHAVVDNRDEMKDDKQRGVLIGGVAPNSPGDLAGLRAGDLVTAVDGIPVEVRFAEQLPAFNQLILSKPVNKSLALDISRNGEMLTVQVTPTIRGNARGKNMEMKEWGIVVEEITVMTSQLLQQDNSTGVLVHSVRAGGASSQAVPPLQAGDIIIEIDGQPIDELYSLINITNKLTQNQEEPTPVIVRLKRKTENVLTVVEVGIREPQDPTREVRKAWLPIASQVLSRKLATALGLHGKKGVRISQVFPEGTAEQAGFKVGDIITQIDDRMVEASEPQDTGLFDAMIREYRVGSSAIFSIIRDGQDLKLQATLSERPVPEKELDVYEDFNLEFRVRDVSYLERVTQRWGNGSAGAVVLQVEDGGWASVGGLKRGDLIVEVDGKSVTNASELEQHLKWHLKQPMTRSVFLVKRGIKSHFLELVVASAAQNNGTPSALFQATPH